jgi:hypothetical protein
MHVRSITLGCLLGAAISMTGAVAVSQDGGLLDIQYDMEAAQHAQSLGPQHEFLAKMAGEWTVDYKVYFAGPDGPAVETSGTSTIERVLDGRFLLERSTAEFRMPDGQGGMASMEIDGIGLLGYDRHRKQFTGTWCDSLNTHLLTMSGTISPDGTMLTMYGRMDEPGLGVTGRMVKYVTHVIGDDERLFEITDLHAGDDYKVVEITYRRK